MTVYEIASEKTLAMTSGCPRNEKLMVHGHTFPFQKTPPGIFQKNKVLRNITFFVFGKIKVF